MIEMQMQRRQRHIVVSMLCLHQPARQLPLAVTVDVRQARDAMGSLDRFQALVLDAVAKEIAKRFRAVAVATPLHQLIELLDEIVVDGDRNPLHPRPSPACFRPYYDCIFCPTPGRATASV